MVAVPGMPSGTALDTNDVLHMVVDGVDEQVPLSTLAAAIAAINGKTLLAGPQQLTNETTGSTSDEQWGTEELVIDDATLVGTTVSVLAHLTGFAERSDLTGVTAERGASLWLEVSLDGGSTWSGTSAANGGSTVEWHGNENERSRKSLAAQVLVSGTVTGDIQVRAMVSTFHAAGKPVFKDGAIAAVVTHRA